MANQKACKKASTKRLSDAEIKAKNASRKAGKTPLTAEQKEAKRLAKFLSDFGQILAEAGIDTSNKDRVQLQPELNQYQASLAEKAKAEAKAQVKGFNPQALAKAESAVEANPPQCAADLEVSKVKKGLDALQDLLAMESLEIQGMADVVDDEEVAPLIIMEETLQPKTLKAWAADRGLNFFQVSSLYGFTPEEANDWDELAAQVSEFPEYEEPGDVAAPTEEAVELPQQEAIEIQPEEVVTMTANYTNQILAVVPGPASSVQEAIELAVQAAYQPDMAKVQAARKDVYERTLRLVDNAIERFTKEAEAKAKKDEEAILIKAAEQEGFESAIVQAMADYGHYGINQEMLIELVAQEEAAEKEAAAKAKLEAEQEALLKTVNKSYKKTVALTQQLINSGVDKMVQHGNVLSGVVKKFEGKRKALNLTQSDVTQLNAQTQKGLDMLEHARRVEEGRLAGLRNKAAKQAMKEAALKWLLSKEAADFLGEEYVTHMSVGEYSEALGLAYRKYLAGQSLASKGVKTKQVIEQEQKAADLKAAVTQRGAKPSVEEQASD